MRPNSAPHSQVLVARTIAAPEAHCERVERGWLLTRNADPTYPYRRIFSPGDSASKTPLKTRRSPWRLSWGRGGIKVSAITPGFTKTNLNNYQGTETVEEGARAGVRVALLGPDSPTERSRRQHSERSRVGGHASDERRSDAGHQCAERLRTEPHGHHQGRQDLREHTAGRSCLAIHFSL